jgi:hypothetical protein
MSLRVLEPGRRRRPRPVVSALAAIVTVGGAWAILFGAVLGLWLLLEAVSS